MASEEDFGSLFEGMVLFTTSDVSPPPPPPDQPPSPPPPPPPPPPLPPLPTVSQPLDEDLFSDLTLLTSPISDDPPPITPSTPTTLSRSLPSRRKKRAVRIGYARDDDSSSASASAIPPSPPSSPPPLAPALTPSATRVEEEQKNDDVDYSRVEEEKDIAVEDRAVSIEEKLEMIRSRISEKLHRVHEMAASVSTERKELGRMRRKAADRLNSAALRYKELEEELEEACEAEDFERAERVSENLVAAEKEKNVVLMDIKRAEDECDTVDVKMQEVLDLQIAVEEEGVRLLEEFAKKLEIPFTRQSISHESGKSKQSYKMDTIAMKLSPSTSCHSDGTKTDNAADAAETAEITFKRTEETSFERVKEWQSSMEILEARNLEVDIKSHVINEACVEFKHSIEHLVEDDRKEEEMLRRKQDVLATELEELLAMARKKEAEIADNNSKIQEVERRISGVLSEFLGTQSDIDTTCSGLQSAISQIESERELLYAKKKEIDESVSIAEQKQSKLRELASVSADEARINQDLVKLRKSLASSILMSREDKVRLAKMEEKILEDIQTLRQENSTARTFLQELSSTRACLQQEVASVKQKIAFIDKRGPELEAEKRVAAASRNFKEAGRIAAEARALNMEKENLLDKREKAVSDIEKLEDEIKATIGKVQKTEEVIVCKEKEAAIAGYQRLLLIAAAARADRSAALELNDLEEGSILLQEAEAAESKARELQTAHGLGLEEHDKPLDHLISIALVTNLAGLRLVELASSFHLSAAKGT